jgi:serine/threonine-protein kinase
MQDNHHPQRTLTCPSCGKAGVLVEDGADGADCPQCGRRIPLPNPVAAATTVPPTAHPLVEGPSLAEPVATAPPRRLGRYELGEEIARGGMGTVLLARDPALNRDLAVKVLRADLANRPEMVRRFLEEAQITAQLPHPGIVPVHELGYDDNGLPFLAMKLVRGQTLEQLLAQRGSSQEELPRFVGIFEQVCQAVAFAHSHGVIHRDLKPANVMVGRFGEVQVMDWGLAKPIGQPPTEEEKAAGEKAASVIRTLRTEATGGLLSASTGERGETEAGTVLGTPAYMPSEQAAGQVQLLDERCDVFGLGAVLCEIVTGRPPYVASESWRTVYMAAVGELQEAYERLDGCGANAELVALVKECLNPDRSKRPRDAGVVAERVGSYLAAVQERLRKAERDRAAAQTRAVEEGKRRRLTLTMSVAILFVVLAGGAILLWYQQDRAVRLAEAARREVEIERDASLALQEAANRQEKGEYAEATAALRKAEGLLAGGGPDPLRCRVTEMRRDLEMLAALGKIRLQMADVMIDSEYDPMVTSPLFRAAFQEYSIDIGALDVDEAARRVSASVIRAELVEALENWALDLGTKLTQDLVGELPRLDQVPADTEAHKLLHQIAPIRRKILQVVEAADPRPGSVVEEVRKAAVLLERDAHRRLAASPAVESLPAAVQFRLAANLYVSGGPSQEVVSLLRRARGSTRPTSGSTTSCPIS